MLSYYGTRRHKGLYTSTQFNSYAPYQRPGISKLHIPYALANNDLDKYKQLNNLQKKVRSLDYYAPDKQHKTMMNILSAERSSLECSQRQESEQYEREKQKKLNKLYNEIEIMKSGYYTYIVSSVTITTNMPVCKITGSRRPLYVLGSTKEISRSFMHTIINKPVEIIR